MQLRVGEQLVGEQEVAKFAVFEKEAEQASELLDARLVSLASALRPQRPQLPRHYAL